MLDIQFRSSTIVRSAVLLWASASLLAACGGSAEFSDAGGGSSGQAGTGSAGTSSAGTSSGGAGEGGSCATVACLAIGCGGGYVSVRQAGDCCPTCVPDGSGGSAGSHPCTGGCSAVGCATGYKLVVEPGACCPSCVPDGTGAGGGTTCADVACPAIDCATGYQYQSVKGQCCGTCVPDPQACSDAQKEYRALRSSLVTDAGARSCSKYSDCRLLAANPQCGDPCPADYVNAQAAKAIDQQLKQFAVDDCSSCPSDLVACESFPPPVCVDGTCGIGP